MLMLAVALAMVLGAYNGYIKYNEYGKLVARVLREHKAIAARDKITYVESCGINAKIIDGSVNCTQLKQKITDITDARLEAEVRDSIAEEHYRYMTQSGVAWVTIIWVMICGGTMVIASAMHWEAQRQERRRNSSLPTDYRTHGKPGSNGKID